MAGATLLFVAGASPQIITETVYCLRDSAPLDEDIDICILTTRIGAQKITDTLLAPDGAWAHLTHQYPHTARFRLHARSITLLLDRHGHPLEDVRSVHDSDCAAEQIMRTVATLTSPHAPPLHASIAGGRKTMGYLLATAMMLYGRPQDHLSHVLISPATLEGSDFFFPPRSRARTLTYHRPNGTAITIPRHALHLDITRLPFLRLRALQELQPLAHTSFTTLVHELQHTLDARSTPRLQLLPDEGVLICHERRISLSPVRFAIYELLAEHRAHGCQHPTCLGCEQCSISVEAIQSTLPHTLRQRLRTRHSIGINPRQWGSADFRSEVSKIKSTLRRALHSAADTYTIHASGSRGARRYTLHLPAHAIHWQ